MRRNKVGLLGLLLLGMPVWASLVLLFLRPCRMIAESGTPTQTTPPGRGGWKQPVLLHTPFR